MEALGRGASGLPQPPDTALWFMSKCQPQSCFPPGQGHLQWASGEVACPASVFTVLRRHREPDLGRPGWAAPLGPRRVHTHFPETEHRRPACLTESSGPATRPLRAQLLVGKHPGKLWHAVGPREPEPGQEEPGAGGERKGCPPSRQVHAVLPGQVCIPSPSFQVQGPFRLVPMDWLVHTLSRVYQHQPMMAPGPNPATTWE